jgi:hypothetical protein
MANEVYKCSFCEKKIRSGADVYGLGVKLKEGLEYPDGMGRMTAVHLPIRGKAFPCMATADNSQAKMEGWDLVFIVCSEKCGNELKIILEGEKGLFEEIM